MISGGKQNRWLVGRRVSLPSNSKGRVERSGTMIGEYGGTLLRAMSCSVSLVRIQYVMKSPFIGYPDNGHTGGLMDTQGQSGVNKLLDFVKHSCLVTSRRYITRVNSRQVLASHHAVCHRPQQLPCQCQWCYSSIRCHRGGH